MKIHSAWLFLLIPAFLGGQLYFMLMNAAAIDAAWTKDANKPYSVGFADGYCARMKSTLEPKADTIVVSKDSTTLFFFRTIDKYKIQ